MRRAVGLIIILGLMLVWSSGLLGEETFPEARTTLSFGFLLLAAYLLGDAGTRLGLPKITGYIVGGILFGPFVLDLVSANSVKELKLIDDLALTFIALAAGGELRIKDLRRRKMAIILSILFQTVLVFGGVCAFVALSRSLLPFLDGKPWGPVLAVGAIIGTFALARSPSSAIAIISECKARGPFTEMVLGVTVVMDVMVIIVFAIAVSIAQVLATPGATMDFNFILLMSAEIVSAIIIGVGLGYGMIYYIKQVRTELLVFILAVAFLVTFTANQSAEVIHHYFGVHAKPEPMLVCMTAGFVVQNASEEGELFIERIDRGSLPIYVMFFSLTGAALDLSALQNTWLIGILIVAMRTVTICAGAYFGGWLAGDPKPFRRMGGLSFITQAGVSLGLAGIVQSRFPEWGPALATMIIAVITVNQVIGPPLMKLSLKGAGETADARSQKAKTAADQSEDAGQANAG